MSSVSNAREQSTPNMASRTARCLAAAAFIAFFADLTIQPASAAPATQLAQAGATQIEAADMGNFVTAAKAIVALRRNMSPVCGLQRQRMRPRH